MSHHPRLFLKRRMLWLSPRCTAVRILFLPGIFLIYTLVERPVSLPPQAFSGKRRVMWPIHSTSAAVLSFRPPFEFFFSLYFLLAGKVVCAIVFWEIVCTSFFGRFVASCTTVIFFVPVWRKGPGMSHQESIFWTTSVPSCMRGRTQAFEPTHWQS